MKRLSSVAKISAGWFVLDVVFCVLLSGIFGLWFLSNHAAGAWGDDAPGYMYTAGQILRHEPLVVQDTLVQQALDFFGDEHFARFVAPAHHEIIAPSGWVASRYPIGLSVLMAGAAWLWHSDTAMYLVVPLLAVIVVVLTYVLGIVTLPLLPAWKRVAALMAALAVGLADVFANYAVAEPMREIPSMVFFLASLILLVVAGRQTVPSRWRWILIALAGVCFGYSVNIRETSAVLLLPLGLVLTQKPLWSRSQRWRIGTVFAAAMLISLSVSIWNSAQITMHKEKFRSKDISRIAITSNFDHIQSLNPHNLFDNEGKFKPGVGGVQQYWEVLNGFSVWPPFVLFALVGVVALWQEQRRLAAVYVSWFLGIYGLFAMWINPYPRYILPLLPAVALLSAYGVMRAAYYVGRWLQLSPWWQRGLLALAVLSFFVAQRPAIADRNSQLTATVGVYKAITVNDLEQLRALAAVIEQQASGKPALLIMFGDYKGGLAETTMIHTGLRVIRFPSKPNEQPQLDNLAQFLSQLEQDYTLFVWYDPTISAKEQRLLHYVQWSDPLLTQNYSFQPNVTLYAITTAH